MTIDIFITPKEGTNNCKVRGLGAKQIRTNVGFESFVCLNVICYNNYYCGYPRNDVL